MTRVFFTILSLTFLIVGALFATSDYSYAEKELGRCKLNGSPRELSDPELKEIFKCDQLLLIVENKLKIEDQVFLLGKLIEGFPNNGDLKSLVTAILVTNPTTVKIVDVLKFSNAIRPSDPEPLIPLSEIYIESFRYRDGLAELPSILSDFLNKEQVKALFLELLESSEADVKIGTSRIIFKGLENRFFEKNIKDKALATMKQEAEGGNYDAFSELVFFSSKENGLFSDEAYNYELVRLMRKQSLEDFSSFVADMFLDRVFLSLPSGTLNPAEIKKLFEIAINDNHYNVVFRAIFLGTRINPKKTLF